MAVTIGSNIASIGAQRQLARNTEQLSNSYEKLSSGQRINRASDDAAGLAIADSLRSDARLHATAVRNLNDGISATNIMSSAIGAQNSILTRLAELSEQSATGTVASKQREALNEEYRALVSEITRIRKSTSFNGVNLLDSSSSQYNNLLNLQAGIDGSASSNLQFQIASNAGYLLHQDMVNITDVTLSLFGRYNLTFDELFQQYGGNLQELSVRDDQGNQRTILLAVGLVDNNSIGFLAFERSTGNENTPLADSLWGDEIDAKDLDCIVQTTTSWNPSTGAVANGRSINVGAAASAMSYSLGGDGSLMIEGLTISSSSGLYAPDLGQSSNLEFTTLSSQASGRTALDRVKNRIDQVGQVLGKIGAYQSRIQTAISNLRIARENTLSAEDRIRSIDIASESAELVKAQILQKVSASVLSQANQSPALALLLLS